MLSPVERRGQLVDALRSVIPDVVHGAFTFRESDLRRVPDSARDAMATIVDWSVLAYAVPITDDGLWVWHQHGDHRSLMANYVLAQARDAAIRTAAAAGDTLVSLTQLTDNGVSMVEVGELAGLGVRGWNNLLLHPEYGSWMQIEAVASPAEIAPTPQDSPPADPCIKCMNCINDCPAQAISVDDFRAAPCAKLVAAPWNPRSRAVALTAHSYIECRECISSCPVGEQPEGILSWRL